MNNALETIAQIIAAKNINSGFVQDLAIMDEMKKLGLGPLGNDEVSVYNVENRVREIKESK